MTPAIEAAKKAKIPFTVHQYRHDPSAKSFGEEAAQALGLNPERVFKTLITSADGHHGRLVVAVIPVHKHLDLKALASVVDAKRMAMADEADAERTTGYVVGGISPLGQRKRLPLILDESALRHDTIYVSAGRRGLEIELAPHDLIRLSAGKSAPIAR
jgi:Cys-tRNA(Pro)/Cys-tRNA(Cys) deacylase